MSVKALQPCSRKPQINMDEHEWTEKSGYGQSER